MKRNFFKTVYWYMLMLSIPLLLGGWGGGNPIDGGSAPNPTLTPGPTGTITGSINGTTIIAVNQNGDIVAITDTAGRDPDVDNNHDGVPEFSFTLTGIPVGQNVRVYLVTKGITLSLYLDSNGDGAPDTNVFILNNVTEVKLGFVDTEIKQQEGKAIPQLNPIANALVSAGAENQIIPITVTKPPTAGLSVSQLNEKGLHALSDGWTMGTRTYFEAAYQQVNPADKSVEADTARFFFALSRVAALGFDTLADSNSSDMNRLGDILDRAGIPNDLMRASWQLFAKPFSKDQRHLVHPQLAPDTPTGSELSDFLYRIAPPELQAAINILNEISPSFNKEWIEGINENSYESDYGDVLFFRGVLRATLAGISIQKAYNLNADIDQAVNPGLVDENPANNTTVQAFLNQYADFLKLAETAKLAEAKNWLAVALDDFSAALDAINSETDDQLNDLVTLDSLAVNYVDNAKGYLAKTKQSILSGATNIVDYPEIDPDKEDITLNLQRFFDVGVDFRNPNLSPAFIGNRVSGLFPEPTFNGVVLSPHLNKDLDRDTIPDIADDEIYPPYLNRINTLAIDFCPYGIWLHKGDQSWVNLHGLCAVQLVAADLDGNGLTDLVVNFGNPYGIWVWMNSQTWVKLHALSPVSITATDLDNSGKTDLAINFGAPYGIWLWMNNQTWTKLHDLSPTSITATDVDGNGKTDLAINFGAPYGIWLWMNNQTWTKLHDLSPASITTARLDGNAQQDLIIDFAPYGIWLWMNNQTWVKLHTLPARSITVTDLDRNRLDEVVIDFKPYGLWVWTNNQSWTRLHTLSSASVTAAYLDDSSQQDLIIDFAPYGIWQWMNNQNWVKLHDLPAKHIIASPQ